MIAAISWIPKGAAKSVPAAAEPPSKEEIEEILKSGIIPKGDEAENGEDNKEDTDEEMSIGASGYDKNEEENDDPKASAANITEAMKELDMENYDDEEEGAEIFGPGLKDLYYPSNNLDPYLKDKDDYDSEEEEDTAIKPDDAVIVCARNEDDVSHLEIWILEDSTDNELNMYVHHDIIIPAFPLCTAWLDCPLKGGEKGNFMAVGSMEPAIEIWDLDIIDEVLPSVVLGGVSAKKKGKKKSIKYKKGSHKDSVLGLAWNKEYRNVIASASADKSVKIWDVSTETCNLTMKDHDDKVQAVAWNPFKPQILLSGSFDHSVILKDVRQPSHDGFKFSVADQVESLKWDPHAEHSFLVSMENGTITSFDIRVAADPNSTSKMKPNFTLHAHDKAVCSISFNPLVPNLIATGSLDKTVKLWDLSNNQPSCLATRNPKAGAVFSISFSDDCPFLLAIGGSKGKLEMWNLSTEDAIARKYDQYVRTRSKSKQ
ncbi:unnamed protein product [Cuscuta epithymum]|uniref:EIPR1-like beta-propeller domain-containing protein n=1 Tax=Cuscuta epithymum TaxID=186058 RepID=A0AAV0FGS9_9ASTE|nr:unnamed protein product [Cuscuta epithymum]